jgi:flagellar basal-body rod modification protein FlgD
MSTAVTGVKSANQQQVDYLNLLITQLKNQDPMNPMDNAQMAQQLAQFSQLQQTEQLNSSFKDVLLTTQMTYGESLMGRQITFMPSDSDKVATAHVMGVSQVGGEVQLQTDFQSAPNTTPQTVAVKDVLSIGQ